MQRIRVSLTVGAAVAAALVVPGTASASVGAHHQARFTTVVSGLNAPRGIVADGRTLYVAESGVAGDGTDGLTHTGAVSRFDREHGAYARTWSTSFESLYVTENQNQPPDVLGPEGLSGVGCDGYDGWDRHRSPCRISMIASESHDGIAAATGGRVQTTQAGHLFTLDGYSGRSRDRADVGDQNYRWTADHTDLFPSDFPDSNPYGVLVTESRHHYGARHHGDARTRTFVIDAGANTVDEVMRDGTTRVIAYIPNETAAPFRDATPTCAAMGRDGMLYVGTLDLLANFGSGGGRSNVWQVDPDASFPTAPRLWASGLTTVTACAFDSHGNFWATEMFADNGPSAPPGDIVRVDGRHPDQLQHVGAGQLPLPGGIAFGRNGALYVTTNSASPVPGSGAVVGIDLGTRT